MNERNQPMGQQANTQPGDTLMQSDAGFGQARSEGYGSAESGQQQQYMGESGSLAGQIREHMAVMDADGTQVGTVDSIDGDQIKLTRQDSADGQHHYLSMDNVAGIEGGAVRLHGSSDSGQ